MDKLVKWLENLLRAQKKSRAWRTFVSCLAAIVVFTTTYSLILPAITVESSATDSVGGLVVQEADPGSTGTGAEASADVVTVEAENETPEDAAAEEPSAVEAETASAEEAAPKSGTAQTAVSQTEYVETSGNTAAYEEVKEPVNGEVQTIGDKRVMTLKGEDFDIVVSGDLWTGVSDGTVLSVSGIPEPEVVKSYSDRISEELLKLYVDRKTTEILYRLVFTDENQYEYVPTGYFDIHFYYHRNTVDHSRDLVYAAIYNYLTDEMVLAEKNGDEYETPVIYLDEYGAIAEINLKGINFQEFTDVITLVAGPVNEELKKAAEKAAAGTDSESEAVTEKEESAGDKTDSKSESGKEKTETTDSKTESKAETGKDKTESTGGKTESGKTESADSKAESADSKTESDKEKTESTDSKSESGEKKTESSDSKAEKAEDADQTEKTESTAAKTDSAESKSEGPSAKAETSKNSETAGGTLTVRGSDYTVTLSYGADAKIPSNAGLEVTEIESGTRAYKKYLAQAKAAMGLDKNQELPKEQARFFDIRIMADGKEVQPSANVSVNITYDQPVVEAEPSAETQVDASAVHFGKKGAEVVAVSDVDASRVEFEAESFSVYGVIYTVDFFYEGKTWSLTGEGSYRLSDVLAELGIDSEIDNALLSILEGEDHEGALYLEKKSGEYWITSDISFTDTYELRVQIGEKTYSITVTDPPAHARPTTNLNDLVSNFNLTGATANGDGTYTVKPGVSYGVDINFTESERTFQFDNHRELVYELPTGVSLKSINSPFDITVNYLGNNVTISGNTVEIRGGKLVVKLNDGDPNFRKFEAISTAQIRIHGTVEFDQNQSGNDIVIPGGGTYHVDGNTDVRITKSGRITDFESGKVEYTLNVTSVGSNNGVTITDTLEGGAFTRYDASSIKLYDKNGAVVNGANASVSGKTFTMTTGPLQDGNYQLKYVAYLNKSDLTENGNYLGTADDTKNTVTWDGDHETTHNLGHIVEKKTSWKGAGSSTTNEQGIATTPWTITAYTSPLERLANVGDEIKTAGTIYSGTGFDVKITDVITNQVVGTTHVNWPAGKTDTTWSYDFRNLPGYPNEGKYWKYDITYTTQTNMSNATQSQQIVNEGGPDDDKHTGTGTVNPPEANRTRIEKTAVSVGDNNEVTWRIKLTIPKTGVDSTRSFVTEHLPSSGRYKDTYVEGSFQFEGTAPAEGMPAITVLENGDVEFRWAKFNSSSDKRTITFTFRSKYDPAWIADENAAKYHANDAEFNGEHSYDGTTYNTPVFKKAGSTIIEENGEFYFDFDVRTNKITNGSFGENGTGTITFTDTYDSRLEFVEGSVIIRILFLSAHFERNAVSIVLFSLKYADKTKL